MQGLMSRSLYKSTLNHSSLYRLWWLSSLLQRGKQICVSVSGGKWYVYTAWVKMNAPVSLCRCVYVCLQGWAFVFFRRNKCNLRKGSVVEPCQGVLGTQRQKDWEQEWLCHSHSYNHEKCAVSVRVCVTSENILCSKVAHRNLLLCMDIMLFTSVFRLTCIWLTLTLKVSQ